jgi:hypothetical protein
MMSFLTYITGFFMNFELLPTWSKGQTAGHIFGREPSNDYLIKILFLFCRFVMQRWGQP